MNHRRLPSYARAALDTLRQTVARKNNGQNGLPHEKAKTVLAEKEELSKAEIDTAITMLHNYGEIYYVGEEIRLTEIELSDTDIRTNSK
jgi:hypothetical protein